MEEVTECALDTMEKESQSFNLDIGMGALPFIDCVMLEYLIWKQQISAKT